MSAATIRWMQNNRYASWLLTIIRVVMGFIWVKVGWAKLGTPEWTGDSAGTFLNQFLKNSFALANGSPPEVAGWYASFLQEVVSPCSAFFSHLVAYGELLTGIALLLGCFTSLFSLSGMFMNLNYLLAGISALNPLMLMGHILLFIGGPNAGKYGLDRWTIPALQKKWAARKKT